MQFLTRNDELEHTARYTLRLRVSGSIKGNALPHEIWLFSGLKVRKVLDQ